MTLAIRKLNLSLFRCYSALRLETESGLIILTGPNGAGKTNLLEAISMLTPGKGLRNAKLNAFKNHNASPAEYWAVSAEFETVDETIQIGTGQDSKNNRRIIRINGETARSQAELANYTSAIWLTPQMDGLFLDSPSARRRFLDRLVFNFDPAHVGRVQRLDKAIRERSKILRSPDITPDPVWLTTLETTIADTSVAIVASRQVMINRLQQAAYALNTQETLFPVPLLSVSGWLETALDTQPALHVEEELQHKLSASRMIDAAIGGASFGAHKSDLNVFHNGHNMPADQCSTGEQKALLISIMLANARLSKAEKGHPPLLLLDEVIAHLDATRRGALFDILQNLKGQCWLTGTDKSLFSHLRNDAQFFDVNHSRVTPSIKEVA